jgi:hypothetical protein
MAMVQLWDPGEGYRSFPVSRQRRLNFYIELAQTPDKTPVAMFGTHGLTLKTGSLGASIVRGARTIGTMTYLVAGNTVYTMNNAGVITSLGNIGTSSGRVTMSDNGTQLILVDGTSGWIVVLATGVLSQIVDPNFPNGATTATFLGGYFIVNKVNTGQFWWSNVYDGTTWNALQFATAEYDPDNLLAVFAIHGELLLFGERTIEIWALSSDANIFRRIGGAAVEWGLAAVYSIDRFREGLMFLSKNRMGQFQVVDLEGYTATVVSTPDVEWDLNQQSNIAGATAYSYWWFGHPMYQINFPNKSYLYDGLSNAWQEVGSGTVGNTPGRHYGEVRFELLSVPYVSDYRNGNIYMVDQNNFTDNGDPITSRAVLKHVFEPNLGWVTMDEFQIDMETGVGLASGQGSAPIVMFQQSRDGGKTFGQERALQIGAQGNYLQRAFTLGLGLGRDFCAQLTITDPVKRALVSPAIRVR